jgi:hypothetical protein
MAETFRITAHTPNGPLTVSRPTAQAALEKARELIREGIRVTVAGPDGSEYQVECLSRISCAAHVG